MMFTDNANQIFQEVISNYKVLNTVDQSFENKYNKEEDLIAHLLMGKTPSIHRY